MGLSEVEFCRTRTEPENRFPLFFENKTLLAKTNRIRFLALLIPNYMQHTKEIDISTTAAKLKFCLNFTESRF